jgi:hypothetical protein
VHSFRVSDLCNPYYNGTMVVMFIVT